jgi:hypothetical protein
MFLKKKVTAEEFADKLAFSLGFLFSEEKFRRLFHQVAEAGFGSVETHLNVDTTFEWLLLGLYLFRNAVSNNCADNLQLRDTILDALFSRVYSKMPMDGAELREFETNINEKFEEYHKASHNSVGAGPGWHIIRAFGRNLLGQDGSPESVAVGMAAMDYGLQVGRVVKKLFAEYKVKVKS